MKKILFTLGVLGSICIGLSTEGHAQIIVDNSSKGFSASSNWLTGTGGYGGTFRYRSTAPVADPATWAAGFNSGGVYQVYAWWPAGANRTTTATYLIYHSGGTTTVVKNQQINGGQWNLLGTFNFGSGTNQVKLTPWTTAGFVVVADAIKWQ